MKKINYLLIAFAIMIGISSCKKEDPTLIDPPTDADALFTYAPSAANPNIIEFTASNPDITANWDFGNGTTGSGTNVSATYPYAGTYTVLLTVFNQGGSNFSEQEIIIANDDLSLLDDPIYNALTGGTAGPGSKTWVMDSTVSGHIGVGPDPVGAAGDYPEWWAAGPLDKAGVGMYDDRYVFHLNAFKFDMITNDEAYVHNELAGDFPGSYENLADYTAPFPDQLDDSWTLSLGADTTITLSGESFMGMYTGVQEYRILMLNDTALWLQYKHHSGGLNWYLKLIPEGFEHTGVVIVEPSEYNLPIDFEGAPPVFTTFGGSSYNVIANPDPSGINTSANVAETVHGVETWAGLFVNLINPLDFSTNTQIALKVWAPATGPCRIKIENSLDPTTFLELDADVTVANAWVEIFVDFAGAAAGTYDRLVVFPGWDVASAGTFYIDDLKQQ